MEDNIETPENREENVGEIKEETPAESAAPKTKSRRRRPRHRRAKRSPEQQSSAEAAVVAEATEAQPAGPAEESIAIVEKEEVIEGAAPEEKIESPQPGSGRSRRHRRRSRKGKRPETAPESAEAEEKVEQPQKDRTKRILINARYPEEKRVAIVEGDTLVDFYVEVTAREHLKGNIYKGVVSSLMPGLQAAFVSFGPKKHGFLQFREVMHSLQQKEEGKSKGTLVKGQEILVQVEKDEHGTKGASLTTYISIPGRYIVMMPGQSRVGVSRKIENREDRDRLKETFNALKLPKDTGFILRTACSDSLEKELNQDLKYLTKVWDRIKSDSEKQTSPALIYKEQDIAMRTVRDYLTSDVAEILIDDQETYSTTKAFLRKIMPWRKVNITSYKDKKPLFSMFNIEAQISRLSHREVTLPSRGYIVFDKAEALTAIDVNSGRSRKEENIESTAFTTNLEAAEEIARQLRLRDIGGLVVVDFIDMESGKNRRLLENRMRELLSADKANTEIAGLSKFCIMEISRERLRPAYSEAISRKCPMCEGLGSLNSDEFTALSAARELHSLASSDEISDIVCRLSVQSANILINARKREVVALEKDYGITINIVADSSVPSGKYQIDVQKKSSN